MAKDFYKQVRAYDIAFGNRDFDIECDFLEWCLDNFSTIPKPDNTQKSFLELAAGPSRHAREFAKRGWNSIALDLSEDMMNYAAEEAKKDNIKIETLVGDMCNFRLKKPVTLAASLMESIAHLVTNDQIVTHLRSVADNLVPGGIYVIEATHPMFVTDKGTNKWTSREGNMKVESTFGLSSDEYDSITQQWMVTTRMKVWNGNGLEAEIENQSPMRWYFPQELKALIDLSNAFEKYWFYGSMYFIPPQPLDESDDSDALVIVLRKKK